MKSHAAAARQLLGENAALMDDVLHNSQSAMVNEKMRALLAIAAKVRKDGRLVTTQDVQRAKDAGADDRAIHDTVLITAMFCMFNRYVDGFGTSLPDDESAFDVVGARIAEHGYGSQFQD